jgi:predicted membrane-bound dolichyl-phosphate-mannose-protein mannosyltransferase
MPKLTSAILDPDIKLACDDLTSGFQRHRWLEWLIPAVFCVVTLGQSFLSSRELSLTPDEATHLYSGYRYLKCRDFTVSPEHPPLAKSVAAAPLLAMNYPIDCTPFKGDAVEQAYASNNWLFTHNWREGLARARIAISLFGVGLALLVWISSRRMFDVPTAIFASSLLIFEPNILAYSPLVMNDVAVTCMLLFVVFGFYLWVKHRTIPYLLLTGLATGLTLLTKHSGVIALPILAALAITEAVIQPNRDRMELTVRNLLAAAVIVGLSIGIVWAGYWGISTANPSASSTDYHLLPRAYLVGIFTALELSHQNPVVFVAGRIYSHAPWFSTPLNFLIRITAAMLALIVVATFGFASSFRERRRECLFLLVPAVVFLAVCLRASTNVSVRYLLPMFPFLLIGIAAGCAELVKHRRGWYYVVVSLILLHAASSLHAYPNYLSYANDLWGGPARAYKYEPWLDIGQAYPETKAYLAKHRAENCWLITAWHWDPSRYDVPCHAFSLYLPGEIPPRVHGSFIVSSTLLTDVRLPEAETAVAFKYSTPKDKIGGSALLVYEGDFDTSLDTAAGETYLAAYNTSIGQPSIALEHAKKAVAVAPTSAIAHANLCFLLAPTERDSALKECSLARSLLGQDPLRAERGRRDYLKAVEKGP